MDAATNFRIGFSQNSVRTPAWPDSIDDKYSPEDAEMVVGPLMDFVRRLRRELDAPAEESAGDAELVDRFARGRDEAAFALLLERHGPMVWTVCRRLLASEQDAEDAFQATFLVLARRVSALRQRELLAGWLHGVACRTARAARRRAGRRRFHEQEAAMRRPTPSAEASWSDLAAVLDEEINRLPLRYRLPVVLCHLQGLTYREAARQLRWPEGSVSGQLARARELLRRRLTQRGITLSTTALATLVADSALAAPMPGALAGATLRISLDAETAAGVSDLARTVMEMSGMNFKLGVALSLLAVLAGAVVWAAALSAPAPEEGSVNLPQANGEHPKKVDAGGDPLPAGALARLGTVRLKHPGYPRIAFLPDGKRLVSGGVDNTVRLWDLAAGKELRRFGGHYPWVNCVAAASDGSFLVSGGADEWIKLWDPASGKLLREIRVSEDKGNSAAALAVAPTDKLIAVAHGGIVQLIDVGTGQKGAALPVDKTAIHSLAFFPDGNKLAGGGRDGKVRIWELATGLEWARFELQKFKDVAPLAVSGDGKFLVAGTGDFREPIIHVWDVGQKKELYRLDRPRVNTRFVTFALVPGADTLLTAEPDGAVIVRDLATGKEQRRFATGVDGLIGGIRSLVVARDGKTLATTSGSTIRLWDLATGKQQHAPAGHDGPVYGIAFAPDGETVATGGDEKGIFLWERSTGKLLRKIPDPAGGCVTLAFSADGKQLLTASNHTLRLIEVASGKELSQFGDKGEVLTRYAIAADARTVAIIKDKDQDTIVVHEVATGKELCRIATEGRSFVLSPDGKELAVIKKGDDFKLRLYFWNTATGKLSRQFPAPPVPPGEDRGGPYVNELTYSPDGKLLAVTIDQSVRFWEVTMGQERCWLANPKGCHKPSLAVSPDGKLAALGACGLRHHFDLWSLPQAKSLGRIEGHQDMITALAFSADGRFLATASGDSTVLIWETAGLVKKQ